MRAAGTPCTHVASDSGASVSMSYDLYLPARPASCPPVVSRRAMRPAAARTTAAGADASVALGQATGITAAAGADARVALGQVSSVGSASDVVPESASTAPAAEKPAGGAVPSSDAAVGQPSPDDTGFQLHSNIAAPPAPVTFTAAADGDDGSFDADADPDADADADAGADAVVDIGVQQGYYFNAQEQRWRRVDGHHRAFVSTQLSYRNILSGLLNPRSRAVAALHPQDADGGPLAPHMSPLHAAVDKVPSTAEKGAVRTVVHCAAPVVLCAGVC